jgi:hypothetical protein
VLSVDNRSADKQPTQDCLFLLFLAKAHTQGFPGPGSAQGHLSPYAESSATGCRAPKPDLYTTGFGVLLLREEIQECLVKGRRVLVAHQMRCLRDHH